MITRHGSTEEEGLTRRAMEEYDVQRDMNYLVKDRVLLRRAVASQAIPTAFCS